MDGYVESTWVFQSDCGQYDLHGTLVLPTPPPVIATTTTTAATASEGGGAVQPQRRVCLMLHGGMVGSPSVRIYALTRPRPRKFWGACVVTICSQKDECLDPVSIFLQHVARLN
jgi:hypothetical protein